MTGPVKTFEPQSVGVPEPVFVRPAEPAKGQATVASALAVTEFPPSVEVLPVSR